MTLPIFFGIDMSFRDFLLRLQYNVNCRPPRELPEGQKLLVVLKRNVPGHYKNEKPIFIRVFNNNVSVERMTRLVDAMESKFGVDYRCTHWAYTDNFVKYYGKNGYKLKYEKDYID